MNLTICRPFVIMSKLVVIIVLCTEVDHPMTQSLSTYKPAARWQALTNRGHVDAHPCGVRGQPKTISVRGLALTPLESLLSPLGITCERYS